MRTLDAYLADYGLSIPSDANLRDIRVSGDGMTLAGWYTSAVGGERAFVAVIPRACDAVDFNRDTLTPDVQDVADFLSVFAGGVCDGQSPSDPPCNADIDFNNDGQFPDADDIGAMIRVFAGGQCW
jgi:hypothetical protein